MNPFVILLGGRDSTQKSTVSLYCILTLCQGKMSKSNRTSQSDKLDEIREELILLNEKLRVTSTFFMEFLDLEFLNLLEFLKLQQAT